MVVPYLRTALIVTVLALSAALWYSVRAGGATSARLETAEKALQAAEAQRQKDARLLAARQVQIASQARKSKADRAALSEALQASEAWAGTSVPPGVQSALGGAVEGLE